MEVWVSNRIRAPLLANTVINWQLSLKRQDQALIDFAGFSSGVLCFDSHFLALPINSNEFIDLVQEMHNSHFISVEDKATCLKL